MEEKKAKAVSPFAICLMAPADNIFRSNQSLKSPLLWGKPSIAWAGLRSALCCPTWVAMGPNFCQHLCKGS